MQAALLSTSCLGSCYGPPGTVAVHSWLYQGQTDRIPTYQIFICTGVVTLSYQWTVMVQYQMPWPSPE
jgi:hypothetical protein